MQLIMSGNPNLGAIQSALYFANKHYDDRVSRVLFIDNEGSLVDREGVPIEPKRSAIVRDYIKRPFIESIMVERESLHHEIPRILSEKLKAYGHSDIIVD